MNLDEIDSLTKNTSFKKSLSQGRLFLLSYSYSSGNSFDFYGLNISRKSYPRILRYKISDIMVSCI
jgi:hypothetical protein